jgi:hypothetical protein
MRNVGGMVLLLTLLLSGTGARPQASAPQEGRTSLVIVFNDGRRQSFLTNDDARIEFKGAAMLVSQAGHQQSIPISEVARIEFGHAADSGRGRFVGKWRVGEGNGNYFYITLQSNGEASKSIGAHHGTWTVVEGEARISWDDGWHDAIRRVGNKFEKVAFGPGRTFSDPPSNVTEAESTSREPI